MSRKGAIRIGGVGCSLVDYLYRDVSFGDGVFKEYVSQRPGDGGIIPGGLVFSEDLEAYSGKTFSGIARHLLGGKAPDTINLGGPAIVALVHAAQLLEEEGIEVSFFGAVGDDSGGKQIDSFLEKTPVKVHLETFSRKASPATTVLSDPRGNGGRGERSFINTLGAALSYQPEMIPHAFFRSDIALFGGTALVPAIHDNLGALLRQVKEQGGMSVVGTVYDFRNEQRFPDATWPLAGEDGWKDVDLLVTDAEEAFRLSGERDIEKAARMFIDLGVGAAIITQGADSLLLWVGKHNSAGFLLPRRSLFPVSAWVDRELEAHPEKRGDTTGCGDNFLGGLLSSLAEQLQNRSTSAAGIDLEEALAWGAASGGFACFHLGGMYHQKTPGEKRKLLEPIVADYRRQLGRG
jgi:sugar/nucleoside kinase (ribokinase family)